MLKNEAPRPHQCPYTELGHEDRYAYLQALATEHSFDFGTVARLADTLGPEEDFDGLVKLLQDMEPRP